MHVKILSWSTLGLGWRLGLAQISEGQINIFCSALGVDTRKVDKLHDSYNGHRKFRNKCLLSSQSSNSLTSQMFYATSNAIFCGFPKFRS